MDIITGTEGLRRIPEGASQAEIQHGANESEEVDEERERGEAEERERGIRNDSEERGTSNEQWVGYATPQTFACGSVGWQPYGRSCLPDERC